jgi:hypothetical protein
MSRHTAIPRQHLTVLQRAAVLLGLVAMLSPVFATLVHRPAAVWHFIHICGIAHTDRDGPVKMPGHKLPACPICHSLHLLGHGFVPPAPTLLFLFAVAAAALAVFVLVRLSRHATPPQARPRAPPAFPA